MNSYTDHPHAEFFGYTVPARYSTIKAKGTAPADLEGGVGGAPKNFKD